MEDATEMLIHTKDFNHETSINLDIHILSIPNRDVENLLKDKLARIFGWLWNVDPNQIEFDLETVNREERRA